MKIRNIIILSCSLILIAAIGMAQENTETIISDSVKTEITTPPATSLTAEIKVCTGIEDRQPIGESISFSSDNDILYLWSQIFGATDSTFVNHIWLYNGDTMSTVELPVRSAAWRTWSTKTIIPSWTGEWEVLVTASNGATIKSLKFVIEE